MEEEIPEIKKYLQAYAEAMLAATGAHLEAEEFEAYHFKTSSVEEMNRMREHLTVCRDCTTLLRELTDIWEPREENLPRVSAAELDAGWEAFEPRLRAWQQTAPPTLSVSPALEPLPKSLWLRRFGSLWGAPRLAYALAILLLLLTGALAIWLQALQKDRQALLAQLQKQQNTHQQEKQEAQTQLERTAKSLEETHRRLAEARQQNESLKQPARGNTDEQLELQEFNLSLADSALVRGDPRSQAAAEPQPTGGTPECIELMPTTDWVLLTLPIIADYAKDAQQGGYRLEITRNGKRVLRKTSGLSYDSAMGFRLLLPRAQVSPGKYRFQIYRLQGGRRDLVSEVSTCIRQV